jgi:hypothetical protein
MVEGMDRRRALIVADMDVTVTPTHAQPVDLASEVVQAVAEGEIDDNE